MNRDEIIAKTVELLEKIASVDCLNRIYRFVKYVYIYRA